MRSSTFLLVVLIAGCGWTSHSDSDDDIGGGADADADADDGGDAAVGTDSGVPSCAAPRVYCDAPQPTCPAGQYPAVSPERCEFGTSCVDRCWTGECQPCMDECRTDADCVIVGRFGCCGSGGACSWVTTAAELARDPCLYDFTVVRPDPPPEGCPTECSDHIGPECLECLHCGADGSRCEGGSCVKVWTHCEPEGCWGCQ